MNSPTADAWGCLKIPDLHLPKTNVAFSTLLLQFLVIHGTIQTLHRLLFSRLHLSPIVSQLFAGFILAPHSPLGETKIYQELHGAVFPDPTQNVNETLAMIGYVLFMFVVAVKMDFTIISRTGRKAFAIGLLDLIVPIACESVYIHFICKDFIERIKLDDEVGDLYMNMTTIPLTHFPNIAVLLDDLQMSNSELGRLALSSSLIGHIVSMGIIFASRVVIRRGDPTIPMLVPFTLVMVSILVIRPIMKWMIKQTPKDRPVKQVFVYSCYSLMLLGALSTQLSGLFLFLGAFIVGSVVPDGLPLGAAIVEKLDFFISGLLLPFFVTTAAMEVNCDGFGSMGGIIQNHISVAMVAYVSKFFTNLTCGLYTNLPFYDAVALGFIMCTKGIVDIGLSARYLGSKTLSTPGYTIMVLWTTFAAVTSPVFIRCLYHPLRKYAGFQRRDIMHCKYNSELRMLACFMKSEHVASITRLLNACFPSENNPVAFYVLHLVKLVGRAHPAFISHDMQKKKASRKSYSEEVIWALTRFQQILKSSFISISVFTVVSPFKAMHEDMCTLALDKLVSIIILPFYRKFGANGSICFEDHEQKILNSSILNRSPCSVGILVDRGRFNKITITDSSCVMMVAVIYIGGGDDEETLAFAMRLGRDPRVRVCVIRLVAYGEPSELDDLDSSVLSDVKMNVLYEKQFSYVEKTVKDGSETASFLKSSMGSYDLVMVGRHYDSGCIQLMGLKDMSEDTDLGAIGDLLASQDIDCRASLLVVQLQRHWAFK